MGSSILGRMGSKMKTIPLTQGKTAMVDDADYEELSKYPWHALYNSFNFYAVRHTRVDGKRLYLYMHRHILCLPFGDPREGDHRDGDGLNNQRYNLRVCTKQQNIRNQRLRKGPKSSQFKGVSWHTEHQRWASYLYVNGRQLRLGYFSSETDAALAYNVAALTYHGEFARLNVVASSGL